MQITINIQAPELVSAINNLAAAFGAKQAQVVSIDHQPVNTQLESAQPAQPQQPTAAQPAPQVQSIAQPATALYAVPTAPAAPVAPTQPQQPTQQPAPQPATTAVPTTAQSYTLEQLAVAATPLADAGRQAELAQLLQQFGVQALTQLPKERYGEFATALRAMGARI